MSPDLNPLEALTSRLDPVHGVVERFVPLELRSGRTIGVLASPQGPLAQEVWISCHAFGREQVVLMPTEATIARRLAARGLSALRFHCQGYGDSEHTGMPPSIGAQIEDVVDAATVARSLARVEGVGLIGLRLGASVALGAAARIGASRVALIAPVASGKRYADELVRSVAMTGMLNGLRRGDARAIEIGELRDLLARQGYLDHRGLRLTASALREIEDLQVPGSAETGMISSALIVQISASERPDRGLERLADDLRAAGLSVTTRVLLHRRAVLFGIQHVRMTGPAESDDPLAPLYAEIAETVASWAVPGSPQREHSGTSG